MCGPAALLAGLGVCLALVSPGRSTYLVDDLGGVERRFDGIGGISGGGATSKLLVGYPDDIRSQILDYLFLPKFAAALQILKVEIGGDAQTTDGTESSHMHESWDENYQRGYEWWLMVEAKKRNPSIRLYGLPWAFPGWVGRGSGSPYKYPNDTAMYVVNWVMGAKKYHDLDIDFIGIWNEREYDKFYIETLKSMLVSNNLTRVQLVAADGGWDISHDILNNSTFAAAVDIVGGHYPGTVASADALKTGKPLWASEDYSTFNDNVGAGCWARLLNQNYVNGMMTSTISWNLIASYYEALPFARSGLMTADQPWSGHYTVNNPIWVTAHTTQFTEVGWHYLQHGHGVGHLDGGGSYVSLTSPQGDHLSIVIETMSHDHSVCIRPGLPAYNVSAQQAEFKLAGSFADVTELRVWRTQLRYDGTPSSVFTQLPSIKPFLGLFTMTLDPDQIYTLTTLATGKKGDYGPPPDPMPFPFPFIDNFNSYMVNSEAHFFSPQIGVWEVHQTTDLHSKVNRQVVLNKPINGGCDLHDATLNVGGDYAWTDVMISMDVMVPSLNGSGGAYLATMVNFGSCDILNPPGVFFTVYPHNNFYIVSTDMGRSSVLTTGSTGSLLKNDTWFNLTLITKGSMAFGMLNSTDLLFQVTLPGSARKNGFVAYGTAALGIADFDNLNIQSPDSLDLHFYRSDTRSSAAAQQQPQQPQQQQQQQEALEVDCGGSNNVKCIDYEV